MQARLLRKFLSQMIQSFQTTDLREQPLLITLLYLLQTLPSIGNVLQDGRLSMIYTLKIKVLHNAKEEPCFSTKWFHEEPFTIDSL